jgi:Fic-DOC domain mobile mystery protein B
MGLELSYDEGQTPLDEDEKEGLLIISVSTREELDEFEQENIQRAMLWVHGKKFKQEEVLSEGFVKELHKRMFGDVWKWAGTFRKTNKNLGVDKFSIGVELKALLDDCQYWIAHNIYPPDEIAIRFKYRLVSIHCFANGNGRHSRLMADIIIEKLLGGEVFSWGEKDPIQNNTTRTEYIRSMKEADKGNIAHLLKFARS